MIDTDTIEAIDTTTMSPSPDFVAGYRPGTLGRIVELHGVYYAPQFGPSADFEGLVAVEMREFLAQYRSDDDLLLTANVEGRIVGSIAVEGPRDELPTAARLRWVIVDVPYQGRGIGKQLLERALAFCRNAGHRRLFLWTIEGLPQSFALYQKAGFRIVERFPDERYGAPAMNLRMELEL
jgi:GNAT superfamily N-acetyltransferase